MCDVVKIALAYRQELQTELSAIDDFLRTAEQLLALGSVSPTHTAASASGAVSDPPVVPADDELAVLELTPQRQLAKHGLSFRGACEKRVRDCAA